MSAPPKSFDAVEMEPYLDEVRRNRLLIDRVDEWLFEGVRPWIGRRVLEVGSGHGNFLPFLLDRELVVATEYEPTAVAVLAERFGSLPQCRVRQLDICEPVPKELAALGIDTVLSVNAFEHIEDDELALRHVAELLVPGGHAVILVPAHRFAYGRMDESIGHFRRYDKRLMGERMASAGLQVQHQRYVNVLGLAGWWFHARVLRSATPPEGQLRLFNQLVPWLRAAEDRLPPPVGLTLATVARRP